LAVSGSRRQSRTGLVYLIFELLLMNFVFRRS